MQDGAQVHEGDFLVEIDAELVSGQGDRGSFDVDIDGYFFGLVVFDADEEIVLESPAGVVEHGYHHFLVLFFVEGA